MAILGQLKVEISASSDLNAGDTLDIQVKVENTGSSTMTVLTWQSPLDPQAGVLGLFEIRDTQDGSVQQGKVLMVNRMMPPSQDSLVEIPANGIIEKTAQLKMFSLQPMRLYEVMAKGEWKGVWDMPRAAIDSHSLEEFEGASTGGFVSNKVMVRIL